MLYRFDYFLNWDRLFGFLMGEVLLYNSLKLDFFRQSESIFFVTIKSVLQLLSGVWESGAKIKLSYFFWDHFRV